MYILKSESNTAIFQFYLNALPQYFVEIAFY